MRTLLFILQGCAVIVITFLALVLVAAVSPRAAIYLSALVGIVGALTLIRPLPAAWIRSGLTSVLLIAVALFASYAFIQSINQRKRADEELRLAQQEVRLKQLRTVDPIKYLAELKAAKDPRWESEAQLLDRPSYAHLIAERVAKLQKRLKTTGNDDFDSPV